MKKLVPAKTLGTILFLSFYVYGLMAQPENDICETATVINGIVSDGPFVCIESSNVNALPEDENNNCQIGTEPTVWYQVTTDGNATLMNIHVTSSEFSTPTISLYNPLQGCTSLQPVPLTELNLPCIVGSNGEAEAIATGVFSNQIYYIAVGSLNSNGGSFEICINTISASSVCVIDKEIIITSRSSGGPLEGPFLPGEIVGVCFNVNSFTASNNGCQWFQGIIPVFGNGWDPASFDVDGQPLNATINGTGMGVPGNGLYSTSIWDWFADVGYHHNNPYLQIGDFDGNGRVDLCHVLYGSDCPDVGGITGGCCGPCWPDAGDILPPGWFSYGIQGTCNIPGPPITVDWGDGNTCGCCMGPWSICFDLIVRDFPDCHEDATTKDLTLEFYTFADGEVGSWTGGASVCALDHPAHVSLPMCCGEDDSDEDFLTEICGNGIIEIVLDKPDVEFWSWTSEANNVSGSSEGEGNSGTIVIDTLINTGDSPGSVLYYFEGVTPGGCYTFEYEVSVDVLPLLDIQLELPVICDANISNYIITSSVSGGSGDYEYLWLPGENTTPNLLIQNPIEGQVYSLIVYDHAGCVDTASIVVEIDTLLDVSITSSGNILCENSSPVFLSGQVNGGQAPYSYLWTLPGGAMVSGQTIESDTSGLFTLSVSDMQGCLGMDSIEIMIFDSLTVSISLSDPDSSLCSGDTVVLTGIINGGQNPYVLIWDTPSGSDTTNSVTSLVPGLHTLIAIDSIGCTDTAQVFLFVNESPQIDSSFTHQDICFGDTTSFTVLFNGGIPPFEYFWNTPAGHDSTQTIPAFEAGTYSVVVTDSLGCSDFAAATLSVHDLPHVDLGMDTIITNQDVVLDAGPGFISYLWNTGNSTQTIIASPPGWYFVIVTDSSDCTNLDSVYLELNTRLSDPILQDVIRIKPNPNNGIFFIEGNTEHPKSIQIQIMNSIGQLIYFSIPQWVGDSFSLPIDLSFCVPDVYFLHIRLGGKIYQEKVVIQ